MLGCVLLGEREKEPVGGVGGGLLWRERWWKEERKVGAGYGTKDENRRASLLVE